MANSGVFLILAFVTLLVGCAQAAPAAPSRPVYLNLFSSFSSSITDCSLNRAGDGFIRVKADKANGRCTMFPYVASNRTAFFRLASGATAADTTVLLCSDAACKSCVEISSAESLHCYDVGDGTSLYLQDEEDEDCTGGLVSFPSDDVSLVVMAVLGGSANISCNLSLAPSVEMFVLASDGACFRVQDEQYWSAYAAPDHTFILHTECRLGCIDCLPTYVNATAGQCVGNRTLVSATPGDCSDKSSHPAAYRLEPILIASLTVLSLLVAVWIAMLAYRCHRTRRASYRPLIQ